jgi:hypothetical protein
MRKLIAAVLTGAVDLCFTLAVVYYVFISDINARLSALEDQNAVPAQETQAAP